MDDLRCAGADAPGLAIIIPLYKHPVFISEALHSVLNQDAPFAITTVIVNDGCPLEESAIVAKAWALAHPAIYYLEKPNGGLSSARNFGIDFVLKHFASVDAVYFLDADNRITPNAMRDAHQALNDNPGLDWIYPNIDKFGMEWNGNYSPSYSKIVHLNFDNICEAGSLVSRRLLDAGIRFDESMRSGFEDWDFWLQAIGNGFVGGNLAHFGFEYRARAESMLRDSDRDRAAINAYLRQKHSRLFDVSEQLRWEQDETPRYALIDFGRSEVSAFTDPTIACKQWTLEEFADAYLAGLIEPEGFGVPPFLLWLPQRFMEALIRFGLVWNVLWLLERTIGNAQVVALRLERSVDEISVYVKDMSEAGSTQTEPHGWMVATDVFKVCVADASEDWIASLRSSTPDPAVIAITVRAPFKLSEISGRAISPTSALLSTLRIVREATAHNQRWNWRKAYFPARSDVHKAMRRSAGTGAIMPRIRPENGRLQIGIALPIGAFGGVEKVGYAIAEVLHDAGADVHLFIFGDPRLLIQRHWKSPFASVNFLANKNFYLWGGPRRFMGHEFLMEYDGDALTPELLGLLSGLDVLLNCHVASLNATLGKLRRNGTKIVGHLHVIDHTHFGRDAGHPYLSLAFEHVYDLFLTCSEQMRDWMHGMGVPQAKMLHIANAPSYEMSDGELEHWRVRRREINRGEPLRVLFLGRLDSQKGVERLHHLVELGNQTALPAAWTLVGGEVLADAATINWRAEFEALGATLAPPIHDTKQLSSAFSNADVLLMTSRWEGAPLTILEAQRLGCVPIATDVGAVSELISNGVDGFLVKGDSDSGVATSMLALLQTIAEEPDRLVAMRQAAMRAADRRGWRRNLVPFLQQIDQWFGQAHFGTAQDKDRSDGIV